MHAVYPGSSRSYLPGYTMVSCMGWMLDVHSHVAEGGFGPGLWGSDR
jgi:hypothetical protein